jgi:hypothetical protein
MRRFIASLLIVVIAFGGVAWSASAHATAMSNRHSVTAPVLSMEDPAALDEPCADGFYGHLCHGSAHFVAILPAVPLVNDMGVVGGESVCITFRHAPAKEPPIGPPKI